MFSAGVAHPGRCACSPRGIYILGVESGTIRCIEAPVLKGNVIGVSAVVEVVSICSRIVSHGRHLRCDTVNIDYHRICHGKGFAAGAVGTGNGICLHILRRTAIDRVAHGEIETSATLITELNVFDA